MGVIKGDTRSLDYSSYTLNPKPRHWRAAETVARSRAFGSVNEGMAAAAHGKPPGRVSRGFRV